MKFSQEFHGKFTNECGMWIEIYGFLDHLWDLTWYLIVLRLGYGLLGYGTTCWEILE